MDGRTDTPSYRDARTHLKSISRATFTDFNHSEDLHTKKGCVMAVLTLMTSLPVALMCKKYRETLRIIKMVAGYIDGYSIIKKTSEKKV